MHQNLLQHVLCDVLVGVLHGAVVDLGAPLFGVRTPVFPWYVRPNVHNGVTRGVVHRGGRTIVGVQPVLVGFDKH